MVFESLKGEAGKRLFWSWYYVAPSIFFRYMGPQRFCHKTGYWWQEDKDVPYIRDAHPTANLDSTGKRLPYYMDPQTIHRRPNSKLRVANTH